MDGIFKWNDIFVYSQDEMEKFAFVNLSETGVLLSISCFYNKFLKEKIRKSRTKRRSNFGKKLMVPESHFCIANSLKIATYAIITRYVQALEILRKLYFLTQERDQRYTCITYRGYI